MSLRHLAILGSALFVAGCASSVPSTQVTRFHLGQPLARGEIVVEPLNAAQASSLEFRDQAEAVSAELARLGFKLAPGIARSELVAVVDVREQTRQDYDGGGSGMSVGVGGGSGSYGGGVGVGGSISFPIGGSKSRDWVLTELSVQIKRRSEGTMVWEGRARSEARSGTPYAAPSATVRRLATALFKDFPGQSGQVVTVK